MTGCHYFDAGRCRSCAILDQPYAEQLAAKQDRVAALVPAHGWREPVASAPFGFRNKAKMVVAGSLDEPTLGILDPSGHGVDLRECPLHEPVLHDALPALADFVREARVPPYDVPTRRGELKHLLVTASPDGELMVRFVLRSQEPVARLRKHLPALLATLPHLRVVSVNLQPEHKAVLEGPTELVLTDHATLPMRLAGIELGLRPQSFFQTNTAVAATLYDEARAWVGEVAPASMWDLYCGVGGFALACAAPGRRTVGVEVSAEAVRSANAVAPEGVRFEAGDATTWVRERRPPELVVVNPPRRGIGALAGWLEASGVAHVLYSSCNAESLARDLAAMPSYGVERARLLDMFPNTRHYEVLTLLSRRVSSASRTV
jgi:23S rRNA (uracil747-C5)-methyltransferase